MSLNVNLGAPYEAIVKTLIAKGYAGNQTEVIRQALMFYGRFVSEDEARLVRKGVETEMKEIRSGAVKTRPLSEIRKKYGL
jgi:Arc/MetJ-type ribon-helix-helix transcriptional regulator